MVTLQKAERHQPNHAIFLEEIPVMKQNEI